VNNFKEEGYLNEIDQSINIDRAGINGIHALIQLSKDPDVFAELDAFCIYLYN